MANFNKNSKAQIRETLIKSGNVKPPVLARTTDGAKKHHKTPEQCIAERKLALKRN